MKNINHKSINFGLKTLTILAFAFIFIPFHMAAAQVYYYGDSGSNGLGVGGGNNGGVSDTPTTPVYQPPIYTPPVTTTPIVYSNDTNPNPVTPTTTVVVHHHPTTPVVATNTCTATNPNGATSGLAANALFGSSGFLPSGLLQWILFAIFVLLIVILGRKVFGAEKKYQESPLKHE